MNSYHDGNTSLFRAADSICIIGPGEAKTELGNLLEWNNLGGKIVGIEAVDKMITPQIGVKVQTRYAYRNQKCF